LAKTDQTSFTQTMVYPCWTNMILSFP